MPKRWNVAVIGLGVGQEHLRHWRSLKDLFEVTLVCDPDSTRRDKVTERLGCRGVQDFNDVLNAPNVDIVDICTPPHLHFDMATRALEAGLHVVCEKPLVNSLEEVDKLVQIAAKTQKICMPISQYRFGSGVQRLKFLVDLGITGMPYTASIETHWNRDERYYSEPWRGRWETERGGVILCHALHLHDLACFVLGDIEEVFAYAATRVNDIETEDCAAVSLKMKNGALVTSNATLGSRAEISRLRFCFENLTAESSLEPYDPGRDPWTLSSKDRKQDRLIAEALREFSPPAASFTGQFISLHNALSGGETAAVSLQDARRSLELVTAIYSSVKSGQPQTLPIGREHPMYQDWRLNQ